MAVRFRRETQRPISGVRYVSRDEGVKQLDRAARQWLNMSGAEFVRRYRAGEIPAPDRSEVIRLTFLMQYADVALPTYTHRESIIRLAITELNVHPLRPDWEQVLTRTERSRGVAHEHAT